MWFSYRQNHQSQQEFFPSPETLVGPGQVYNKLIIIKPAIIVYSWSSVAKGDRAMMHRLSL